MTRITEYVGHLGVHSSDYSHYRLSNPTPGDIIEWPNGKLGMIDHIGREEPNTWAGPGEIHACTHIGSAFLGWSEARHSPTVDISGGPFITIKTAELEPTLRAHLVPFWNWGDNHVLPGANLGCQYHLARPIFRYIGTSTHYSITDTKD